MKKNAFRWAVTRPRRNPVPAALLAPRLKSTRAITMPKRTMTMMTDEDCGLTPDPIAQARAEEYIRAAISFQLRQEAKAQAQTAKVIAVEVPVADDAFSIRDVPADILADIASELRRIAYRSSSDIHPAAHRGQTTTRIPT
ncbi:hypothetical protein [Methylorubrum thiocyanatum]|uniref:hypothetical protein n=1 Tax=Methylorubrum thiocyanatum TaxID=47958 RepID=UPI003F7EFCB1